MAAYLEACVEQPATAFPSVVREGGLPSGGDGLLFGGGHRRPAAGYRLAQFLHSHAWLCSGFVTLGFLVHRLLDEIYSANLMGMEMKSSFGSAFSLGSLENPAGTLALYLILVGLYWLSPPPDAFLQLIFSGETYRGVANRLLPGQGWFRGLLQLRLLL